MKKSRSDRIESRSENRIER